MRTAPIATKTYSEYLAFEESSSEKHEYLRGEVFAMSGGTPEHAALEAAVAGELRNALEAARKPCRVYSANLRVRVESTDFACYPDATVVCGKLETSAVDRNAATNPIVERDVWEIAAVATKGERAELASLGIALDVDAVYRAPATA